MNAEEMETILVNRERYLYRLYESTIREEVNLSIRDYEDTSIDILSRHIEVMKLIHNCGIKNERYDKFLKNSEINIRNAINYYASKVGNDNNTFHVFYLSRFSKI